MADNELPPLPDDLAQLLGHERQRASLAPGAVASLGNRVEASFDWADHAGVGLGQGVAGATATSAASGATAAGLKFVVAAFVAGAAVGGTTVVMLQPKLLPPAAPRVITAPVPAPVPAEAKADLSKPLAPQPEVTGFPRVAREARDAALSRERALLEQARTAVGRSQLEEASRALRMHRAQFAKGALTEERDAMEVQVILMEGELPAARAKLEDFKKRYPDSVLTPGLDSALVGAESK